MTKKAEPTFWLRDNCYIMLTGEVWQGIVHVALMGDTPDTVKACAISSLNKDADTQVEPWTVPFEWWRAFHALYNQIPANPPEKPVPEADIDRGYRLRAEDEQEAAEEELLMHVAAGTDPLTACLAAADRFKKRAYAPIKGPCPLSFVSGAIFTVVILALIALGW